MMYENNPALNPDGPKGNEIDPAIENFNDGDDNQVLNTADDAFDEAATPSSAAGKVSDEEKVLPPGTTELLDDGDQPVLNEDDKAL